MPGSAQRLIGLIVLLPTLALAGRGAPPSPPDRGGHAAGDSGKNTVPAPAEPAPVATDFNCEKPANEVESMVCKDDSLTRLDNRLEKYFARALEKADAAGNGATPRLITEQRRWVKSLKDCLKTEDAHMCLGDAYILRISQLQAAWDLAPALTPLRYLCKGTPARTLLATFYRTHPPTARLELGSSQVIVHQGISASGARYLGQGVEFWSKGRDAMINWRGEALECSSQPGP